MENQYKVDSWIDWYKTVQKIIRSLRSVAQEYNISFEQFLLIDMIVANPETTSSKMGELLNTSAPAVSRKLNALSDKGIVRKIRGEGSDQRRIEIQLTDKGAQIYNTIKDSLADRSLDKLPINPEQGHNEDILNSLYLLN